jgi:hypothetical protein
MFKCGSEKIQTLKQPLSTQNFPELIFSVKNSKLKFDNNDGVFKQISNEDPHYRKNFGDYDKLLDEEENIKKEIQLKKDKIKYINDKIAEIEKKQEVMMKVLNVDVNERDYIFDLKAKLN